MIEAFSLLLIVLLLNRFIRSRYTRAVKAVSNWGEFESVFIVQGILLLTDA